MYYASGIDYKNTMNNAYRLCVLFNTSELIEQNEAYWLPTDGDNLMCLQVTPRCYETSDFITLFERCARLTGFPDRFKIANNDNVAYKQFGNSVVVDVLQFIIEEIINIGGVF